MNGKSELNINELQTSLLSGDIKSLSKAITLIESNSSNHSEQAQEILNSILPLTGKSLRIGITGIPGAGKSTFIESFGLMLLEKEFKVAVLTIDPSSVLTKGSILGDKTRMENLSRHPNCFIRPSPSGGSLGGVANKTREAILLCEAAGFDRILVESIGVGQSEIELRSMVDFLLLLLISGGGDELQGIKKGIIEIADLIAINKADGDNVTNAKLSAAEYSSALKYLNHYTKGWDVKALTCSALTGSGLDEILTSINEFENFTKENGVFESNRNEQSNKWMEKMVTDGVLRNIYSVNSIKILREELKQKILRKEITPTAAAKLLLGKIKM